MLLQVHLQVCLPGSRLSLRLVDHEAYDHGSSRTIELIINTQDNVIVPDSLTQSGRRSLGELHTETVMGYCLHKVCLSAGHSTSPFLATCEAP